MFASDRFKPIYQSAVNTAFCLLLRDSVFDKQYMT